MGTKLTALETYFDPGLSLTLWGTAHPKPGREYGIPLPSAEIGLWCRGILVAGGGIANLGDDATDGDIQTVVARLDTLKMPEGHDEDATLPQIVLGTAYDEMVEDGVSAPLIEFAGTTAYLWIALGEEVAERYWRSGGRPEAARPVPANRAAKRAKAKATGATSTAAASTTRNRASGSSTTTPRKSLPATAAKRSRGSTS